MKKILTILAGYIAITCARGAGIVSGTISSSLTGSGSAAVANQLIVTGTTNGLDGVYVPSASFVGVASIHYNAVYTNASLGAIVTWAALANGTPLSWLLNQGASPTSAGTTYYYNFQGSNNIPPANQWSNATPTAIPITITLAGQIATGGANGTYGGVGMTNGNVTAGNILPIAPAVPASGHTNVVVVNLNGGTTNIGGVDITSLGGGGSGNADTNANNFWSQPQTLNQGFNSPSLAPILRYNTTNLAYAFGNSLNTRLLHDTIYIGDGAGLNSTNGDNLVVGNYAFTHEATSYSPGFGNTVFGMTGLAYGVNVNENTVVSSGLFSLVTGNWNFSAGTQSWNSATNADNNLAIGVNAGRLAKAPHSSIAMMVASLCNHPNPTNFFAIGELSFYNTIFGNNTIGIGNNVAFFSTNLDGCTIIGQNLTNGVPIAGTNLVIIGDGANHIRIQSDHSGLVSAPGGFSVATTNQPFAIPYVNSVDGTLAANSNAMFFDSANFRLGMGTVAPQATVHVKNAASGIEIEGDGQDGSLGEKMVLALTGFPTQFKQSILSSGSGTPANNRIVFALATGVTTQTNLFDLRGDASATLNGVLVLKQVGVFPTNTIIAAGGTASSTNIVVVNLNGTLYAAATNAVSGGLIYSKLTTTWTTAP